MHNVCQHMLSLLFFFHGLFTISSTEDPEQGDFIGPILVMACADLTCSLHRKKHDGAPEWDWLEQFHV